MMTEPSEWSDPELWKRIRSGDEEARARLIEGNFGLVQRLSAKQHRRLPAHVDLDEIIGYGTLGLMRAVENYDVSQKVYFETYAAQSIRSLILDELRSHDWAPRSLRRRQRAIDESTAKLEQNLGREPSDEEIAADLELTVREILDVRQATRASHHKSLDELAAGRDGSSAASSDVTGAHPTWEVKLESDPSNDGMHDAQNAMSATGIMTDEFRQLPLLDQMVLVLKYFVQEPNPKTGELEGLKLRTVGERLGITESRASQIHSRAVVRVRDSLRYVLEDRVRVE